MGSEAVPSRDVQAQRYRFRILADFPQRPAADEPHCGAAGAKGSRRRAREAGGGGRPGAVGGLGDCVNSARGRLDGASRQAARGGRAGGFREALLARGSIDACGEIAHRAPRLPLLAGGCRRRVRASIRWRVSPCLLPDMEHPGHRDPWRWRERCRQRQRPHRGRRCRLGPLAPLAEGCWRSEALALAPCRPCRRARRAGVRRGGETGLLDEQFRWQKRGRRGAQSRQHRGSFQIDGHGLWLCSAPCTRRVRHHDPHGRMPSLRLRALGWEGLRDPHRPAKILPGAAEAAREQPVLRCRRRCSGTFAGIFHPLGICDADTQRHRQCRPWYYCSS